MVPAYLPAYLPTYLPLYLGVYLCTVNSQLLTPRQTMTSHQSRHWGCTTFQYSPHKKDWYHCMRSLFLGYRKYCPFVSLDDIALQFLSGSGIVSVFLSLGAVMTNTTQHDTPINARRQWCEWLPNFHWLDSLHSGTHLLHVNVVLTQTRLEMKRVDR
jgi:hypothetical protein